MNSMQLSILSLTAEVRCGFLIKELSWNLIYVENDNYSWCVLHQKTLRNQPIAVSINLSNYSMRAQNENACPMSTRAISHSVKAEKNQERSPIYNSGILQEARVIKIFMAMVGLFGVFFLVFRATIWVENGCWIALGSPSSQQQQHVSFI